MNHPGSADSMAAHAVPCPRPHRRYRRYSRYLRYPRSLPLPTVDAPPSYAVVLRGILGISELAHLFNMVSLASRIRKRGMASHTSNLMRPDSIRLDFLLRQHPQHKNTVGMFVRDREPLLSLQGLRVD